MDRTKLLDALHAEMAADIVQLLSRVDELKKELPHVLDDVKADAEKAAASMKQSFEDYFASSVALSDFMKKRQVELLKEAETYHARASETTRKSLEGFTKYMWLILGICGMNTVLLIAWILIGIFKG